jgi:cytochrome c553
MASCRRLPQTALIILSLAVFLGAAGCSGARSEEESLFERGCGACHTTKTPLEKRKSLEEWRKTVKVMRQRGAKISDEEEKRIAEYLYKIRPDK